ncbi:MAG: hypothetical protein HKN47_03915, partial [Pirellulaceae bacterium]|nr:hypothetical protein [Pirellulaceae bacterium]
MSESSDTASATTTDRSSDRITRVVLLAFLLAVLSAGFVLAWEIVLILFLGILFGLFLCRVTAFLHKHSPLERGPSLAAVVAGLIILVVGSTTLFFYQINEQLNQASDRIEEGVAELRQQVRQYPTLRSTVASVPVLSEMLLGPRAAGEYSAEPRSMLDPPGGNDRRRSRDAEPDSQSQSDRSAAPNSSVEQGSSSRQGRSAGQGGSAGQGDDHEVDPSRVGPGGTPTQSVDLSEVPAPMQQAAQTIGRLFKTTFGLVVNSLLIFFVGLFIATAPSTYHDGL